VRSAADTGVAMASDAADEREQALEAVARRCARRGFSIAYRLLRDRAEAEDAVQEALARACESWSRLRDPAAMDAWFHRVLSNLCLRALRRRRLFGWLRRAGGEEEAAAPGDLPAVAMPALAGLDAGRLLAAVDRLPPMQKSVVVLRYGEDMSLGDIAAALGIAPETAKTHLARGIDRLRERLRRER
jgi:RNA polymerase sigma-70 factor (ECF subfamily)